MSEQELEQSTDKVRPELAEESLEDLKLKIAAFLDDDRIQIATVVFSIDDGQGPHVLRKGHFYDTAALLNTALEAYRAKAAVELGIS
jgi:hypothetical protein